MKADVGNNSESDRFKTGAKHGFAVGVVATVVAVAFGVAYLMGKTKQGG